MLNFLKIHSKEKISINGIIVTKYLVSNIPLKLKKIVFPNKYEREIYPKKFINLLLVLKNIKNTEYTNIIIKKNLYKALVALEAVLIGYFLIFKSSILLSPLDANSLSS